MFFNILITGFVILIVAVIIKYILDFKKRRDYYSSRGISYLGDITISFGLKYLRGTGTAENMASYYNQIKQMKTRFARFTFFRYNVLMIRDANLIKRILVNDSSHFDRMDELTHFHGDRFISKMIIFLQGHEWKNIRVKLDRGFTPSKINRSFPVVNRIAQDLVEYLRNEKNNNNLDFMKVAHKYALDAISAVGMSLQTNCLKQEAPSTFERISAKLYILYEKAYEGVKPMFILHFPRIAEFCKLSLAHGSVISFLEDVIANRKLDDNDGNNCTQRNQDFIELLQSIGNDVNCKVKDVTFKKDWVTANLLELVGAGFETMQILLAMCAYLLALHPQVQEKVREEIMQVHSGQITCESIKEMPYLEVVIKETLRMHPSLGLIVRSCKKEYHVPGTDVVLKAGDMVFLPLKGLHYDEEHYESPKEFRPERFGESEIKKTHPFAYLPFGAGSRMCIAQRMAVQQTKIAICHLIKNFRIGRCKETLDPMEFRSGIFPTLQPKNVYLTFNRISEI